MVEEGKEKVLVLMSFSIISMIMMMMMERR